MAGFDWYQATVPAPIDDVLEAVIARIEMGCSYAEVAELMGKPSADAARMMVSRALVRLAEEMRRG